MKSTKSEASAVDAGSLFQRGIDLGKKLYLKQSRVVEICLYFFEWLALVFAVAGVRYKSLLMSTILKSQRTAVTANDGNVGIYRQTERAMALSLLFIAVGTQRAYFELKYFKFVKMRDAKYSLKMAAKKWRQKFPF